jgi:hypothetical protein
MRIMKSPFYLIYIFSFIGLFPLEAQIACGGFDKVAELALALLDENGDPNIQSEKLNSIKEEICKLNLKERPIEWVLEKLPMLQVVMAPDSSFIILSGEARIQKDFYLYFGGIYLLSEEKWLCFTPSNKVAEQKETSADEWAGGIHYAILENMAGKQKVYTLLSYRRVDYFRREKRMTVIRMSDQDVQFGLPLIKLSKDQILRSFELEYAAEAPVFFNYDEMEGKIVFDHLIPFRGLYEGQGSVMVPDGSYSAFEWRRGFWHLIEKLPTQVRDTPPLEQPILDKRRHKDILGRNKPGSR